MNNENLVQEVIDEETIPEVLDGVSESGSYVLPVVIGTLVIGGLIAGGVAIYKKIKNKKSKKGIVISIDQEQKKNSDNIEE